MNSRVHDLCRAYARLSRRAMIFEYPVREMQARQWIATTNDTDELEWEMLRFFGVAKLEQISSANPSWLGIARETGEAPKE